MPTPIEPVSTSHQINTPGEPSTTVISGHDPVRAVPQSSRPASRASISSVKPVAQNRRQRVSSGGQVSQGSHEKLDACTGFMY